MNEWKVPVLKHFLVVSGIMSKLADKHVENMHNRQADRTEYYLEYYSNEIFGVMEIYYKM